MAEFSNVREALEFLEVINNSKCTLESTTKNGKKRPASIKDLQEMNYDTIINICDLLGVSDIYLQNKKPADKGKLDAEKIVDFLEKKINEQIDDVTNL